MPRLLVFLLAALLLALPPVLVGPMLQDLVHFGNHGVHSSSWWSACHGYRHPHIMAAVHDQLDTLPHVMLGGMTHEPVVRLAERLADKTPGDLAHTMFTDSGSVAVEVADCFSKHRKT